LNPANAPERTNEKSVLESIQTQEFEKHTQVEIKVILFKSPQ